MYLEDRNIGTLMGMILIICIGLMGEYKIFEIFTYIIGFYFVIHFMLLLRRIWKEVFKDGKE